MKLKHNNLFCKQLKLFRFGVVSMYGQF